MPRQCSVFQCTQHSSTTVQLFKFPISDENRLQNWIRFANRGLGWTPTKSSVICSRHFTRLEFDSRRRIITDPIEEVPKPKIPKQTVQLPFSRTVLTILPELNQLPGGGFQIGKSVEIPQTYTPIPKTVSSVSTQTTRSDFRTKYMKLKKDFRMERLKNNAMAHRLKRSEKKCNSLQDYKNQLWSKLNQCLVIKSLVLRFLAPKKKIDDTLRTFGQSVHYYSSKAHGFIRRSLSNVIPNARIIRKWNEHIQLQPGFIQPSLQHLDKLSKCFKLPTFCSLQFDEIHLKEQIISNGQSFDGYTDYGGYFVPKNTKIANSAIVFMAVGLNSSWKVPIAFFYTQGLPVKFLTRVIPECLSRLDNSGIICKALVCDGLSSNLSSLRKLGANLNAENPNPWILHPNGKHKVHIILDACHMLKLLRNLWNILNRFYIMIRSFLGVLIDSLVRQQEAEGLRAANKLTSRHAHFELQKMKVNLATQIFSESVSKSLLFCEELRLQNFEDCGPTAEFISTINCLFDMLNAMHPSAKGSKAPLSAENRTFWQATFRKCETLLLNLKVKTKDGTVPIHKSKRRTSIIGLICTMRSISELCSELVLCPKPKLNYLLTYKLSQDHVETFFSTIRNVLGCNSNPNVVQFKAALKKVLTSKILPSTNGNCVLLDETELAIIRPPNKPVIDPKHTTLLSESEENEDFTFDIDSLSQYIKCVVSYIAGYVVKKLKPKITCERCSASLETSQASSRDYALILKKLNGGLKVPSEDVIKICKAVEAAYRKETISPNFRKSKIEQAALFSVLESSLFGSLSDHLYDSEPESNHIVGLTKLICKEYLNLRMHHSAKSITLQNKPVTFRNQNRSLTHFAGM